MKHNLKYPTDCSKNSTGKMFYAQNNVQSLHRLDAADLDTDCIEKM